MKEIGQIIGIVIGKQEKYCKLYFLKGSLKDSEETVYKTTTGTTNLILLDSVNEIQEGDMVKCSIIESYTTGINYGIKKCGVGYKVKVLKISSNKLNLDY
ncbi:hypothetical protein UT300003_32060 [Clostridium sardiniense]